MDTLFLFGTVWFWILVFVAVCCIIATTEAEEANSWGWAFLLGSLALMFFMGNRESFINFLNYMSHNPGVIILSFIGYLLAGTGWSITKWYFYLLALKEKKKNYSSYATHKYDKEAFQPKEHKERILNWMIYWPFSALWTLINQPIRKAFGSIFLQIEKTYKKLSDHVIKDIEFKD